MLEPSFLAIDKMYLAFISLSSWVSPGVTSSQLIARLSIEAKTSIKNLPVLKDLSLKEVICELVTLELAHFKIDS